MNEKENKWFKFLKDFGTKHYGDAHAIHTPKQLVHEIIGQIPDIGKNKTILVLFNLEFVVGLLYNQNVNKEYITFYSDHENKTKIAEKFGVKVITSLENIDMKFYTILVNPPYQSKAEEEFKKTTAIWPMFVEKSLNLLKDGGYMGMIHPSGWRNVSGMFKDTQKLILSQTITHLEMNDENRGIQVFGARTTFDVYTLKKEKNSTKVLTSVKLEDGSFAKKYINDLEFIPNGMFDEFEKLIAKPGEETVEVIANSSYHHQREHVSETKDSAYKHPCVYTCAKDGSIKLKWSNTNKNGHFGVPKLFWSNGAASSIHIDSAGKYGLTEFAYAIVDDAKNLENIKKAMESEKFVKLMKHADGQIHKFKYRVISTFRKDFWKEFI